MEKKIIKFDPSKVRPIRKKGEATDANIQPFIGKNYGVPPPPTPHTNIPPHYESWLHDDTHTAGDQDVTLEE